MEKFSASPIFTSHLKPELITSLFVMFKRFLKLFCWFALFSESLPVNSLKDCHFPAKTILFPRVYLFVFLEK
jgi:hypothetical protein